MKQIVKIFLIILAIALIGGVVFGISVSGIWLYSVILINNGMNHPERAATIYQQINRSNDDVPWGISYYTYNEIEMLKIAGEAGYDDSMYLLGQYYMWNDNKYVRDLESGAYWFLKAGEKDNDLAKKDIAIMYLYGIGVKQDLNKAIEYLKKSSDMGDAESQAILGDLYSYGVQCVHNKTTDRWYFYDGRMNDYKSRFYWKIMDKSREITYHHHCGLTRPLNGEPIYHLYNNFGYLLSPQEGVMEASWGKEIKYLERDIEKAKYYWELAVKQGHDGAREQLQRIYIEEYN